MKKRLTRVLAIIIAFLYFKKLACFATHSQVTVTTEDTINQVAVAAQAAHNQVAGTTEA